MGDARFFGPSFPARHLARWLGRERLAVSVPEFGRMFARPRSSDHSVIRQVFLRREYDLQRGPHWPGICAFYKGILERGRTPVIVDAGANIGAASVWFAKLFPLATLVAVEPDPGNASMCRANTGQFSNIRVEEAAIGSEPGQASISNPTDDAWSLQTERGNGDIPIRTVSEIVSSVLSGELFLVKVDIEGFESDLFSSNLEWLAEPKVVLVEPHDWMLPGRGSSLSFQKAMAAHDFEVLISGENLIYVRL
jgi:FkbM family methyltransferase